MCTLPFIHIMDFLLELQKIIEKKTELGRLRTAANYYAACRSLAGFLMQRNGHAVLPMKEVTAQLMAEYEDYLLTVRKIQRNSSSAYMRALRAGYNSLMPPERLRRRDPFIHVYTGIDHTVKRAIGVDVIRRLAGLDLTNRELILSRDLFLFSFYARGIAFIDLAKLTRRNVRDGRLTYLRSKTRQPLSVKLEPPMRAILNKYARLNPPYLFPILHNSYFDQSEYNNALRTYNNHLHRLGQLVGSPTPLSSYVARHSWATTAKRLDVAIRVISEAMGHTSEMTTRIYLDSIGHDQLDAANHRIMREVTGKKSRHNHPASRSNPMHFFCAEPVAAPGYTSTTTLEMEDPAR